MKLTVEHIESRIAATRFISRDTYERLGTLTICVLELKNGIQVVGQSACLDESTFDAETGKELARRDAVSKVWQLEGYATATARAVPQTLPINTVVPSLTPVQEEALVAVVRRTAEEREGVADAYDSGYYCGFRNGWFAAKKDSNLVPGDIGRQKQAQIYDDVSSLVRNGFVTPELALSGAVAQAYKAGYAAHAEEGRP